MEIDRAIPVVELSPRYNAEASSSSHSISPESTSRQTSPRLRNHAIPSTIHENVKEEADGQYIRRSASPGAETFTQSTLANGIARQGHASSNSPPPNAASMLRRDNPKLQGSETAGPSPDRAGTTLRPSVVNKENRNPYYAAEEGKQEMTSIDSKTWVQAKSIGRTSQNHYSTESGIIPNYGPSDPINSNGPRGPTTDEQYGKQHVQNLHQSRQWHPVSTASTELPLITPTIGRSMSSADRRMDEPPLSHQLPPFVAYDPYQQAMTPMANGYPHMQPPQQAPPTVSQLPAGRKAFTVRSLCCRAFLAYPCIIYR